MIKFKLSFSKYADFTKNLYLLNLLIFTCSKLWLGLERLKAPLKKEEKKRTIDISECNKREKSYITVLI